MTGVIAPRPNQTAVLTLLALDGVLSAVAGALLLPIHLGPVPFPVSAVASGLVNATLVWAAGYCTESTRLAAVPLWAWLGTVAVLTFGGPGIMAYSVLLFLVLGALPGVLVLRRMA